MKILQVMAGGEHGGAETAYIDMCIAMHERGLKIQAITRPNDTRVPRLKKAGITVHTLPFGGLLDIYTPWRIKQIAKAFQPDIIQTWMSRASCKTPKWDPKSKIPRYHVVARLGGYYKLKYFTSCDYFATITPDIKRYLIENGIPASKVKRINNFAETEPAENPASRAAHDIPNNAPLLLGLGRLHSSKGFDTLIESVAELPGVYCWIAGEGPLRKDLEHLIKTLKVQDRVKLLGWRSDRAAIFQASNICVFSSRYEPFGTVFVQAWEQRTPLISTRSDGPKQFVQNEQDGLLIDIDDKTAMKKAIIRLISDQNLADTLVENGYKRYRNEFTKDKCVEAYMHFYRQIIKQEQQLQKN